MISWRDYGCFCSIYDTFIHLLLHVYIYIVAIARISPKTNPIVQERAETYPEQELQSNPHTLEGWL